MKTESRYKKILTAESCFHLHKILDSVPEVKKAIYEEFEMNVYINKNEIKNTLQAIYDEYGIKFKVKQDTIKDYYDTDNSGSINGGSYKLTAFKFSLVDF